MMPPHLHFLGEPVDLALCITEDNGLGDGERIIKVTERVKLPLLAFHRHKELLDTFQRQLITVIQ